MKMRERATPEMDLALEFDDAPHEGTISNQNVGRLHATARFQRGTRKTRINKHSESFTRERNILELLDHPYLIFLDPVCLILIYCLFDPYLL